MVVLALPTKTLSYPQDNTIASVGKDAQNKGEINMKVENMIRIAPLVEAWNNKEKRGRVSKIIKLSLEEVNDILEDGTMPIEQKELELGDIWSSMRHAGRKYEDFPKAHRGLGQVLPAEMQVIADTAMADITNAFANLPTNTQTILERTCYLGLGKRGGGHTMETLSNYITNHCLNNIVQAYKSGRFLDATPLDDNGIIMVELPAIKPKKEAEVAQE
jgi:hypothetical protein